jgi:hypothetical protein
LRVAANGQSQCFRTESRRIRTWISKNRDQRLGPGTSSTARIGRDDRPERPADASLTYGTVPRSPRDRKPSKSRTLAGWGAWIRTRGWRNQNPTILGDVSMRVLKYRLNTPPVLSIGYVSFQNVDGRLPGRVNREIGASNQGALDRNQGGASQWQRWNSARCSIRAQAVGTTVPAPRG